MKSITIGHIPGKHCASTGIQNIVNFHGLNMSEAMCFGIGEGLGLWYLSMPKPNPSRMVHVRSADFEKTFFTNMGEDFKWEQHDDPIESENKLIRTIDRGIPAIIQTDIYYLPYYESNTHFPGHIITVWGYDRKKSAFIVTDTEREAPQFVPMEHLQKARYCNDGIFISKGNLYAPEALTLPEDMASVISKSIHSNSRFLAGDDLPYSGKPAIKKWEEEILDWKAFDDWQWTARFCYQIIEKRGTGGGGFRNLYSTFLKESRALVSEIKTNGLDERMKEIADAWTSVAYSLKDVSEMQFPDFTEVRGHVKHLRLLEITYHEDVVKIFKKKAS